MDDDKKGPITGEPAAPATVPEALPNLPAIRAIDRNGQVIEMRMPESAQEAVDLRARAREAANVLNEYAHWLDRFSIVLMDRDGATAVIDPDGRTWTIGNENAYSPIASPGLLHDELLIIANDPLTPGGAGLAQKVAKAFVWVEPEPVPPFWKVNTVALNALEALGGKVAAVIRRHRVVTPSRVLRERK